MRMSAALGTALLDSETDTEGARTLAGAEDGRLGLGCSCPVMADSSDCGRAGERLVPLRLSAAASLLTRWGEVRADERREAGRVGDAGDEEERRAAATRGDGGAV
jgi:hypothetical protein